MKRVSMSGSLRENVGKKDAKQARKDGLVPCVLYGGDEQVFFTMSEKDLKKITHTPETFAIELDINGKIHLSILQDAQFHPVTDKALHVDFLEVLANKRISTSLTIQIEGSAPGVRSGGTLVKSMRNIKVRGLIKDFPDTIEIDVSKLKIGDSIKIKDLEIENVKFMENPDSVVVSVKTTRMALPEDEEGEESEEGEEGEESGADGGSQASESGEAAE